MTKAELLRSQRDEMNAMIDECMYEIIAKLPVAYDYSEVVDNGLTLDEVYEISNKFLSKHALPHYLNNYGVFSGTRCDIINFAEVDDNGRLVKNGKKREFKYSRVVYANWRYNDPQEEE